MLVPAGDGERKMGGGLRELTHSSSRRDVEKGMGVAAGAVFVLEKERRGAVRVRVGLSGDWRWQSTDLFVSGQTEQAWSHSLAEMAPQRRGQAGGGEAGRR